MAIRLLIFLLLLPLNIQAKTLYVSTTGSDSTTYANNAEGLPWATVGRATWGSTNRDVPNGSEAAQAGDTVIVQAGTYDATGTGGAKYYPYYNPANSGSAGSYITFQANGTVDLRSSSESARALIGSYQRDYIVWDGFTLNENYMTVASDTGPVVLWDCSYCQLKNLHITGIDRSWADNHNGIRLSTADNALVENCYMTGYSEDHGAGVMTYYSENVILQHNEVNDSQQGLFVKGANPGPFTLRYNYIHDCDRGLRFGGLYAGGAEAYQNLIVDCDRGVYINSFAADGPQNVYLVNNTIVDSITSGVFMQDNYDGIVNVKTDLWSFEEAPPATGVYVIWW